MPGLGALAEAGPHLTAVREDQEAIKARVGFLPPAGRLLGWAPDHGGDLEAASGHPASGPDRSAAAACPAAHPTATPPPALGLS